jgi:hypothetical protein
MKRVVAIVMISFLSGCFEDPKLKANSEDNFTTSLAAVTRNMSEAEKEKLDAALKDIVLVEVGFYGPELEAKSYRPSSNEPGAALGKAIMGAGVASMKSAVETGWSANRAKAVVQNARAVVDGRTAKEIIIIAQDERKKSIDAALAIYHDQLEKARVALNDIDAEANADEKKQAEQKALLDRIEITKPHFDFKKVLYSDDPDISFTIANNGAIPIKRIFVNGKLQTPGRAIPWVDSDFNYEFPGGLEPKEVKALDLTPNMFSDWGKVPKETVSGVLLTLTLLAFEDASGKRIGSESNDVTSINNRKKALQDEILELEEKIKQTETQTN